MEEEEVVGVCIVLMLSALSLSSCYVCKGMDEAALEPLGERPFN